jgi:glutamate carboxypeptidase
VAKFPADRMSGLYALRDFCRGEHAWLVDTIEALVRLESPTNDKDAVDRCGRELASRLEALGGRVTRLARVDAGDHLRAEFGRGDSQVLLLGHFDTVWPIGQLVKMPLVRSNGRLHGPGIFDMKAGVAIGMLAARALFATGGSPARRIVMLWTTDEEVGSATSRAAIEEEAQRSAAVFVLEPALPGGAVKTARKGCGQFELTVTGVAAHAGIDPTKGASAIHELAHQICRLYRIPRLSPGISLNVGIVSGGARPNVVADEARAIIDVRAETKNEADLVSSILDRQKTRNPRTSVRVTGGFDRPPLERTAAVVRLYDQARQIARELGYDLAEGSTGGGSDGNFTAALGVPTLDGLGAVGDGAHALHEHVELDALPDRAALVAGLIAGLQ